MSKMVECPDCFGTRVYHFQGMSWSCEMCDETGVYPQKHFWINGFGSYNFKLIPWVGSDEFGRCTVVIPFITAVLVIVIPKFIHKCPEWKN